MTSKTRNGELRPSERCPATIIIPMEHYSNFLVRSTPSVNIIFHMTWRLIHSSNSRSTFDVLFLLMAASLVMLILFFFLFFCRSFPNLLPDSLSTRKIRPLLLLLQRRLERKLGAKRETIQNQKSKTQEKQKEKKERGLVDPSQILQTR